MKTFAWVYTALVLAISAWAWWIDVSLMASSKEHLLPDMLLAFTGIPLSLTLNAFYTNFEGLFSRPFVQLAFLTAAAISQALILHLVAHRLSCAKR